MDSNLFLLWLALLLLTLLFALFMGKRLSAKTLATAAAGATAFTLLALFLPAPTPPPALPRLLLDWLLKGVVFSAVFRWGLQLRWGRSLGMGFFSAACLSLLRLWG